MPLIYILKWIKYNTIGNKPQKHQNSQFLHRRKDLYQIMHNLINYDNTKKYKRQTILQINKKMQDMIRSELKLSVFKIIYIKILCSLVDIIFVHLPFYRLFTYNFVQLAQYLKYQISMLTQYSQISNVFDNIKQFKGGQEKFTTFSKSIFQHFKGAKAYQNLHALQQKMIFEVVMFLAIIDKKHQKVKNGQSAAVQQLVKPISSRKQIIINRSQCTPEQFDKFLGTIVRCTNFIEQFRNISQSQKQILYHTVLVLSAKQQSKFLFFRSEIQYKNQDIRRFSREFGENIVYANYDNDKNLPAQFQQPYQQSIYLLKAKNRYLILYPIVQAQSIRSPTSFSNVQKTPSKKIDHKGSMRILQQKNIPATTVESIFSKKPGMAEHLGNSTRQMPKPDQNVNVNLNLNSQTQLPSTQRSQINPNNLEKSSIRSSQVVQVLDSSRTSIGDDSLLLCTKVKCTACDKIFSQIDCLYWNYIYYCHSCLRDINVDTTDIPPQRIVKFLKDRNTTTWNYSIECPECSHITEIPNYTPANKNKSYRCNLCSKMICVQHKANIYSCFCYCNECKTPTIYLQKLKINFCQKCRNRYCFKCTKKGNSFCKCVCIYCLGEQSKSHQCENACHSCSNKPSKLRICNCGLFICYGCYYRALENSKDTISFQCGKSEYT